MEKKELLNILDGILVPEGFKKKGNSWVINGKEITKIINLQKSQFGNNFYINYGYIINSIPLNNLLMHIFSGLGSLDNDKNKRIKELLNLEEDISDKDRAIELKNILVHKVVEKLNKNETEIDVLQELKLRAQLHNIPLVVKQHFNLVDES